MVKLQIKDDQGKTTTVPLTRDEVTVGRKEGNTIRLTERNVSRTHARLLRQGDAIVIEDLSRYGTRVNGERIKESKRIGAGDVVQIGDYLLSLDGVAAVPGEVAEAPEEAADNEFAAASFAEQSKPSEPSELEKAAKAQIAAAKAADAEPEAPAPKPLDEERIGRGKGKKRIAAAHPTLVAVTSQLAGTEYPITDTTLILGRTGDNGIVVEHHSISRNHAKVVVDDDGRVKMVDLKSKNGIRVNGEFWEESVLKSGDIVELGKVQFRFVEKGEEFVYRPHDYSSGAVAAEQAPAKSGGGRGWIAVAFLLIAGGLAAAYFLYFNKDSDVANVDRPPTTTAAVETQKVEPKPVAEPATKPAEEPPTKPSEELPANDNRVLIKEGLAKTTAAVAEQKWDAADKAIDAVLAVDPLHPEAQALKEKIASERKASAAYTKALEAQGREDYPAAWDALDGTENLPKDSAFYAKIDQLRQAVGPVLAKTKLDKAKAAIANKQYMPAAILAESALKFQPDNAEAQAVLDEAKRLKAKQDAPKRPKPGVDRKPSTKPDAKKPAASAKTGGELYKDARKIHNSNPGGALSLYQQAAQKGYTKAHKQIGSIHIKLGNKSKGIASYKRYLSLNPGARDAEMVKDIILRLGGTP